MNISCESSTKQKAQDFELNLASIIDCLTVLITFLLASASFLSIGILDAGVMAAGESAKDQAAPPPALLVSVELKKNFEIQVLTQGKGNREFKVPSLESKSWNFNKLTEQLRALKTEVPEIPFVSVSADGEVEYREVVQAMDEIRKTVSVVLLGGF